MAYLADVVPETAGSAAERGMRAEGPFEVAVAVVVRADCFEEGTMGYVRSARTVSVAVRLVDLHDCPAAW